MKKKVLMVVLILLLIGVIGAIVFKNKSNSYLIELDRKALEEKINNKDSFILVISRKGCSHCAEYIPIFTDVVNKYKVKAYMVDIAKFSKDDNSYLSSIANVSGTPTTLFINKGEETTTLNRIVGSTNRENIISKLKQQKYIK